MIEEHGTEVLRVPAAYVEGVGDTADNAAGGEIDQQQTVPGFGSYRLRTTVRHALCNPSELPTLGFQAVDDLRLRHAKPQRQDLGSERIERPRRNGGRGEEKDENDEAPNDGHRENLC